MQTCPLKIRGPRRYARAAHTGNESIPKDEYILYTQRWRACLFCCSPYSALFPKTRCMATSNPRMPENKDRYRMYDILHVHRKKKMEPHNLHGWTQRHRHTRGHLCICFFTALWIYFHRSPPIRCFHIAIIKLLMLNITDFVPESIQYVFHGNRFTIQQHDHPVSRRGGQTSVWHCDESIGHEFSWSYIIQFFGIVDTCLFYLDRHPRRRVLIQVIQKC